MAYLLTPNRGKYELADVVFDTFGSTLAGNRSPWIQKVYEHMRPQVDEQVREVYEDIELPLIPVLAHMERTGIGIDTEVLRKMSDEMGSQIRGTDAAHLRRGKHANSTSTLRASSAKSCLRSSTCLTSRS